MHASDENLSNRNNLSVLAAILSGGLFTALGVGLFAFTIPLMSLDERVSGAWLGTAFAGYYLAKLVVSPISGMASDRFGPKRILILAMCAGALFPLTYFIFPTLGVLYAVQICMGIITGLIRPVSMAALGGSAHGPALSRRFAIQAAIFNAASFAGPLLGSILYFNRDMAPVLLALSVCMALAMAVTIMIMPKNATTRSSPEEPLEKTTPCPKARTMALLLAIGGRTLGLGLLMAFYPVVLAQTLGRHGPIVAMTYAVPGLATFAGLVLSGRIANKKPEMDRVAMGMLISATSLFALGGCKEVWQFITIGAIMGLGAALSIPASMYLASTLARRQGAIFGTANLASGLGFLMGPLLGGIIVQNLHSPIPAIQAAAILGALACLPMVAIILKEQMHWGKGVVRILAGITTAIFLTALASCLTPAGDIDSTEENIYKFTDMAMGTIVNLTLEAENEDQAYDASKRVMTAMRALQQDLDHRNHRGSVGRINRNAGQSWVKPSPRAFALIQRALDYSEKSNGAFDPTIGALTTSPLYYAMDETIAHAKADLVDHNLVLMDLPGNRVKLKKKGMALDLGGIAKGLIVDTAVDLLQNRGITAGIVEAGGDFHCFGDREWTVGIRHPRSPAAVQTIRVKNKGVCGSGDYQQFITTQKQGQPAIRHHIINPSTMDSASQSAGVTVIADTAEEADALATTLFILGPAKGMEFLEAYSPASAAIWFLPDNTVVITDNFPH